MVGGVSSIGSVYYNPYIQNRQRTGRAAQSQEAQGARQSATVLTARRGASPETPVQPVRPAAAVNANASNPVGLGLPVREGADPVEMAVRMRIQYVEPEDKSAGAAGSSFAAPGQAAERPGLPGLAGEEEELPVMLGQEAELPELPGLPGEEEELPAMLGQGEEAGFPPLPGQGGEDEEDGQGVEDVREAAEKGECQTCKERKYQDGSDDPGVSFKTPTNIDPSQAANAVRSHEMEHVTREQAKAQREDRKVVSQSVTYHTAICPECGRVYVSGGTTRTVTAANNDPAQQEAQEEKQERQAFSIMA